MTTTINLQTEQVFQNGREINVEFPQNATQAEAQFSDIDYQGLVDEPEFAKFFEYWPTSEMTDIDEDCHYLLEGKTAAIIQNNLRYGSFVIETCEMA